MENAVMLNSLSLFKIYLAEKPPDSRRNYFLVIPRRSPRGDTQQLVLAAIEAQKRHFKHSRVIGIITTAKSIARKNHGLARTQILLQFGVVIKNRLFWYFFLFFYELFGGINGFIDHLLTVLLLGLTRHHDETNFCHCAGRAKIVTIAIEICHG